MIVDFIGHGVYSVGSVAKSTHGLTSVNTKGATALTSAIFIATPTPTNLGGLGSGASQLTGYLWDRMSTEPGPLFVFDMTRADLNQYQRNSL